MAFIGKKKDNEDNRGSLVSQPQAPPSEPSLVSSVGDRPTYPGPFPHINPANTSQGANWIRVAVAMARSRGGR